MAVGYREECQQSDTLPLLMGDETSAPHREHVLTIMSNGLHHRDGIPPISDSWLATSSHNETVISLSPPGITSGSATGEHHARSNSAGYGSQGVSQLHGDENTFRSGEQTSILKWGLWVSIELTLTVGQIVASIIVLSLSRDEKPKAPLSLWVLGYAAGCLATLPLLYLRYRDQYAGQIEDGPYPGSQVVSSSNNQTLPQMSFPSAGGMSFFTRQSSRMLSLARAHRISAVGDTRTGVHIERFKIALDCFFAVWFVVGNVWIFGGHSSSHEAPNLYRLCIVFLTLSCIGYAMPFVICATICCCLPCIITILGFREDQEQPKGASAEDIEALPIYKFERSNPSEGRGSQDLNDSDSESLEEGGVVVSSTDRGQPVSAEDAACCICLRKYKDSVELRGLPCGHYFHLGCVDKWLKINASCPLCKHEIGGSCDAFDEAS